MHTFSSLADNGSEQKHSNPPAPPIAQLTQTSPGESHKIGRTEIKAEAEKRMHKPLLAKVKELVAPVEDTIKVKLRIRLPDGSINELGFKSSDKIKVA